MTVNLYDPLTYENLMLGLATHFEKQAMIELRSLADIKSIEGPGVYALYYSGDIDFYKPIKCTNNPIYAGKAVPPGSRKGRKPDPTVPVLRRRAIEHSKSIRQAENLDLTDFRFRLLAVEPVWITLAERFLIDHHKPVWNLCIEGFGDHDPGSGRHQGERSWWDTIHSGRKWTDNLRIVKNKEAAIELVRNFFDIQ